MRNAEILQLLDDALTAMRASKPVGDAEGGAPRRHHDHDAATGDRLLAVLCDGGF